MGTFRGGGTPTAGQGIYDQADLDAAVASADADAAAAAASAAAAAASETNAAASEAAAAASESIVAANAAAAAASEANAATSETNAAASQAAAAVSEANALTSENNSADNVTYAAEWAVKAEDSLISVAAGGDGVSDYSSLHWAAKAATWAASVNHPSIVGNALNFIRANAGETGLEYFDLFDSVNYWTNDNYVAPAWTGTGSITFKPFDLASDSAYHGIWMTDHSDNNRAILGSLPGDTNSYAMIAVWDDTLGTPAWNQALSIARDALPVTLQSGGLYVNADKVPTLGAYNTWTDNQAYIHTNNQTTIAIQPGSATYDGAHNGFYVYNASGTVRSFFGAIPGDVGSYFTVWVWNDSLGTPAWQSALNIKQDSLNLTLSSTDLLWNYNVVPTLNRNNTWTGNTTFSTGSFTVNSDAYFTGVLFCARTSPDIGLRDYGATNKNYSFDCIAGHFYLKSRSDVWGDQGNYLDITDTAKTLAMTSTGITYNSQNIPVVDTNQAFANVGDIDFVEIASDYSYTGSTTGSPVSVTEFVLSNVPTGRYKLTFDLLGQTTHYHGTLHFDATFSGLTVLGDGSGLGTGLDYTGYKDTSSPTTAGYFYWNATSVDEHGQMYMYLDVTSGTNSFQFRVTHVRNFATSCTTVLRAKSLMTVQRTA